MLNNSGDAIIKKVETYERLALRWSKKYAYDCLWQVCNLQIPKKPELHVIFLRHELEKPN